jgi:hypothetical protein
MNRDELIEAMARAICTADKTKHTVLKEPLWKCYEKYATAALTAIERAGYVVAPKKAFEAYWARQLDLTLEALDKHAQVKSLTPKDDE